MRSSRYCACPWKHRRPVGTAASTGRGGEGKTGRTHFFTRLWFSTNREVTSTPRYPVFAGLHGGNVRQYADRNR